LINETPLAQIKECKTMARKKYLQPTLLSPILLNTMIDSYGLKGLNDGKVIIKNSTEPANGDYKSYYHKFGLFKSKNISSIGSFENGILLKIIEYDKQGKVVNIWEPSDSGMKIVL
jgi:hypothetical protein